MALTVSSVFAVSTFGSWTLFPSLGHSVDEVIETPSKVYVLSGTSFYSIDLEDNETFFYNTENKLSDSGISRIKYNHDKGYLLILYTSGNIDLLYDNGQVVNLPDLRDAVLNTLRTVNSIFFGEDEIVLSTAFGYVIFTESRHEVKESGLYNTPIENAFIVKDHLVLIKDGNLYASPMSASHSSFNRFMPLQGLQIVSKDALAMDNDRILISRVNAPALTLAFDFDNNSYNAVNCNIMVNANPYPTRNGAYIPTPTQLLLFDKDGTMTGTMALPTEIQNKAIAMYSTPGTVWVGGTDGVGKYKIDNGNLTVLAEPFKPNAFNGSEAGILRYSQDGERLYVTNLGPTLINPAGDGDGYSEYQNSFRLEDGLFTDINMNKASASEAMMSTTQKNNNNYALCGGVGPLVEDPDYHDVYYIANGIEGYYVVRGKDEIMHFTRYNSPIISSWCSRCYEVRIDRDGNLWCGFWNVLTDDRGCVMVLPAEYRRKVASGEITDPKTLTDKWVVMKTPNFWGGKDMRVIVCEKSDRVVVTSSYWQGGLEVIDTKGTPLNTADDRSINILTLTDQTLHTISPDQYMCSVEDLNGDIWFGTNLGIFYMEKNSDPFSADFRIRRPIVPRNDGTSYGDFLLENTRVLAIAVDNSNRKWVSIQDDGIYLISADGTEILEHFDSSNSPLPATSIPALACDPHSNLVYVGTLSGLMAYSSTSSPAKSDFSEVLAYPNPVRPEYDGHINITGLMDKSLVKITDAAGNVFFQTISEGGMVFWDGCNAAGERVKSGVYYVFASSNADGSNSAVVTKILVVN